MYRALVVLLSLLALTYVGFQYNGDLFFAVGIKAFFLLILLFLYNSTVKKKPPFFSLFLITFTLGEIVHFFTWHMEDEIWSTFYYITNLFYILAYIFLLINILRNLSIREMIRSYPVQSVILVAMSIFSVVYISFSAEYELAPLEFMLEVVYNSVVMTLLSLSLLNYVMKEDSKAMFLLLASIAIVFSEMLQYVNNYIAEFGLLRGFTSALSIIAFLLFYFQAKMVPEIRLDYLVKSDYNKAEKNL